MTQDIEFRELAAEDVDAVSGGILLGVIIVVGVVASYMAGREDGYKQSGCS